MAPLRISFVAYVLLLLSTCLSQAAGKKAVAFECTARQEAEDLAAVAAEDYRYSGAIVRLGVCALKADKVAVGIGWLERAAALGDPEAKNNLAVALAEGHGVPRDPDKAHALYLEAAGDGCSDAMYNLGVMYDTGRGGVVAADAGAAAHWFSQVRRSEAKTCRRCSATLCCWATCVLRRRTGKGAE